MDAAAELEEEQRIRLEEMHFLDNICQALSTEPEKEVMRRSMVVMLYSHFEGFTRFCFELYRRAIEQNPLKCSEVQPVLATTALHDLFKAFRNHEQGKQYLPSALQNFTELKTLAIEKAFIENAWEFGDRPMSFPNKYIDMESNLKPSVLRKNLYRLGLPHDIFDPLQGKIDMLLNYRNRIGHGSSASGIAEHSYLELFSSVLDIMTRLKTEILASIEREAYLKA